MTTSGITNINAKLIHQHPDNPRKDLGDLSELSESIKKKGIMQNLTVIPGYWDEDKTHHDEGYTLIIGHRRFAAGKMAGVTMYPCRIVEDMSYTLSVNGEKMVANVGQNLTIDTGRKLAYREDGTLSNTSVAGDYDDLILIEGRNKIKITDGFELKVIPNWRCL